MFYRIKCVPQSSIAIVDEDISLLQIDLVSYKARDCIDVEHDHCMKERLLPKADRGYSREELQPFKGRRSILTLLSRS